VLLLLLLLLLLSLLTAQLAPGQDPGHCREEADCINW